MQTDLFGDAGLFPLQQQLAEGVCLLSGQAESSMPAIWQAVSDVLQQAPLRQMQTAGGHTMSVSMSNCGDLGWISDRHGYRYSRKDPQTGQPWPAMPAVLKELARTWAAQAGFDNFVSNACLINCYQAGSKMSLHQDRDERDYTHPIVTLSLGLPARFMLGGLLRQDPCCKLLLQHGDVLVFGGPARLRFHGIMPVADGEHALLGKRRISLTFRRA
ncbi:DNA oxidative demethylase AlkB [Aquitalea sp. LB_tupeE]|uniref:DNA oxidative demethylase AlkB n=1 Tax=Aquitalea sp. LB_tupeE TaxID=2748078 RepID=UPI0015B8E766|nr:DNA oxidative demethylase AlkB [Aquitalea sp. LB_tupeE]NWK76864.1 DNA oxidative demethylase AlkB [Aquitalea sp. LB_tupeE]